MDNLSSYAHAAIYASALCTRRAARVRRPRLIRFKSHLLAARMARVLNAELCC